MNRFVCTRCGQSMKFDIKTGTLSCDCGCTVSVTEYTRPEFGSTLNTVYISEYSSDNISNNSLNPSDIKESFKHLEKNAMFLSDLKCATDSSNIKIEYLPFSIDKRQVFKTLYKGFFHRLFARGSYKKAFKNDLQKIYYPLWISHTGVFSEFTGVATRSDDSKKGKNNEISYYDIDSCFHTDIRDIKSAASQDIGTETIKTLMSESDTLLHNKDITSKKPDDASFASVNIPLPTDSIIQLSDSLTRSRINNKYSHFTSSHNVNINTDVSIQEVSLLYVPLYKVDDIYINGNSGVCQKTVPVSKAKIVTFSVITSFVLFLIITFIMYFCKITF